MKINYRQAREFLDRINEKDSIAIITHNDMDGFCSGKLFWEFCKKKKCKEIKVFIISFNEEVNNLDLTNFNKILISDLGPSFVSKKLSELEDKEVLYTDHHQIDPDFPISEKVLELRTIFEGYIPSSRTVYEITEGENKELKWVSIMGVIGDMGQTDKINKEFLGSFYSENKVDFDFCLRMNIEMNSVIIYFSPDFINAFEKFINLKKMSDVENLKDFTKEVQDEIKRLKSKYNDEKLEFNGIVYFNIESKFPAIKSAFITENSAENPENVYIFTSLKGDKISVSARNQSKKYDVSLLLKDCVKELEGGIAGGHKVAAGASIKKEDLEKFKERLKQINVEDYRI